MKVLYDFRAYQTYHQRGIGRYVYQLFESAAEQTRGKLYILVNRNTEVPQFSKDIQNRLVYCYLEDFQNGMYQDNEFDVFINGSHYIPTLSAAQAISGQYPACIMKACRKKACIVYDFIPLFFQQYIPTPDAKLSFALQTEALRYLDHIFSISQFTQESAIRYLDLDKSRFTCLYGGADEEKFKTANSSLPYAGSSRKHHLVYVSGAAPQKNNEGFVRAFCKAYRRKKIPKDARLYIICRANEDFIASIQHETETCGCKYGKHVLATDYISDEKMVELLGTAKSSMFPSFYEGLGLPILESYVAGTPCFASGVSATKEFVLEECSFDPFDEESMVDAIISAYCNDDLCSKSLEFGRKLLKKVGWDIGARRLLEKCEELGGFLC